MVFDFLRRDQRPAERKSSVSKPLLAYHGSGRVAWSPRDPASLTRAGYAGNPVGFRAVKLISEAAAAVPLVLQDAERRYEEHPVWDLVRRPNTGQGRAEFLEALFAHLLLTGDAYVEAVGGEPGELPRELHALRPERMRLVPGADGWPLAYEYTVGSRRHRFDAQGTPPAICHVRQFHPQDDHHGLSPMQPAASAVDVHNAASRWSKALLDNAARPSGALVFKGPDGQGSLSTAQYDRLVAEMEGHHQGSRNAGRPMLLEGGLDWKPMGFSPSDMEFQKTKEAAAREIAVAFGVPPMILGIPGDATYANYQEANRAFYRLTVLPLASRVLAALSVWLSDHGAGRVSLLPDPDRVPALAAERDQLWARVSGADFLSDAEKRRLLGLPAQADA